MHVVRSARLFERRVSRTNYLSCTILSRNTALVRCQKHQAFLCKPMYLGACVLDLSKLVMMRHYYHAIKPTFDRPGSLLRLQMTDTGEWMGIMRGYNPSQQHPHLHVLHCRFLHLYGGVLRP